MVEQEAVNFEVAGSSPASGAKEKHPGLTGLGVFIYPAGPGSNRIFCEAKAVR
jgi:hypothetical protein